MYNPMTVLRQTSRAMLKEFFAAQNCLRIPDANPKKLYLFLRVKFSVIFNQLQDKSAR